MPFSTSFDCEKNGFPAASRRRGFTLLELAIVLVVIGLLVGGVLTGQTLIRGAELRAVATEQEKFNNAIQIFQERYRGMPGDLKTATTYWSTATNGDGNGQVDYDERMIYWQHLSFARLIDGEYSGALSGGSAFAPGVNVPVSSTGANGWSIYISWWLEALDGQASTLLALSNTEGYAATQSPGDPQVAIMPKGAFLPSEAWGVDNKIDDGKPTTGFMVAYSADEAFSDAFDGRGCINTTGVDVNSQYLKDDAPVSGINHCFVAFKRDRYSYTRDNNPVWWPGYTVP